MMTVNDFDASSDYTLFRQRDLARVPPFAGREGFHRSLRHCSHAAIISRADNLCSRHITR